LIYNQRCKILKVRVTSGYFRNSKVESLYEIFQVFVRYWIWQSNDTRKKIEVLLYFFNCLGPYIWENERAVVEEVSQHQFSPWEALSVTLKLFLLWIIRWIVIQQSFAYNRMIRYILFFLDFFVCLFLHVLACIFDGLY